MILAVFSSFSLGNGHIFPNSFWILLEVELCLILAWWFFLLELGLSSNSQDKNPIEKRKKSISRHQEYEDNEPHGGCQKLSHPWLRGTQRPDEKTLSTFPSFCSLWVLCSAVVPRGLGLKIEREMILETWTTAASKQRPKKCSTGLSLSWDMPWMIRWDHILDSLSVSLLDSGFIL